MCFIARYVGVLMSVKSLKDPYFWGYVGFPCLTLVCFVSVVVSASV